MNTLKQKLFLFFVCICLGSVQVNCIVSKTITTSENNDIKKSDNTPEQSIKRDYIAGFEETGYGHGAYGLTAHSSYGVPEGYEGYEGGKHYVHHPEEHHHHYQDHHKHYDVGYHKALAIKSLLVPLAGVALLGAAAAFVSNPILLQLGVISSSTLGRRKREIISQESTMEKRRKEERNRVNEIKLLERFMAQVPEESVQSQEKKLIANYLSCSGITNDDCLERLTCELNSPEEVSSMVTEANVLRIVLDEILQNEFLTNDLKNRLKEAREKGKYNFDCRIYKCEQIEKNPFKTNN